MSELTTGQMIDQMDIILKNLPTRSGIPRDARVIYCDVLQAWGERMKLIEDIDPARLRELADAEREGRIHISQYPNCQMCEWVTKIMFANIEPCVSCKARALAEPKGEATT